VSDDNVRGRTGHDLAHWFDVLDRFDAVKKGHTAAARHLRDSHGVDSWYSQGITVAFERARGVRAPNQRSGGTYDVSVSKIVAAEAAAVVAAFADKRRRARWMKTLDPELTATLSAALTAPGGKGFVRKSNGHARCRYGWGGEVVEIYVLPRPDGRSSLVVQHLKLPSRDALERRRKQWRGAVSAIAAHLVT
jgi:hypothetical protein